VEQMKRDAGATEFKPDRSRQPQNIIAETVEQPPRIALYLSKPLLDQLTEGRAKCICKH